MTSLTDLTSVSYHRNLSPLTTFTPRRVHLTRHALSHTPRRVRSTRHLLRCSVAKDTPPVTPVSSSDVAHSGGMVDCVVVRGGISGLCIAQALVTKHATNEVIVTEARERVGGNISTVEKDGYLWEEGPNSFQPSDAMLTMVVDCGLKDDLVLGDPTAPRFVLWNGDLKPVPSSPSDLPFFDLLSFSGKLRAGFGALGLRPSPPVCTPGSPPVCTPGM